MKDEDPVSYFRWDKALQNMLTEKDLLTDIIANAPSGSIWNITEDSWERIPVDFSKYQIPYRGNGWDIEISEGNHEDLIKKIEEFEIYDKIVHQRLFWQGELLFVSYDHMTGPYIRRDFPSFSFLLEKYSKCEFYWVSR
ncbi:hypothetical protein LZD49_17270 [Dyadobacter sp. CY261]|uniref:hypothetical protein n=1 Tax=Dyadobacter sp. CY261 TaxID=2907203 RepID=UPI001F3B0314|nr:hypothetical protein [Dyadobacter sp. CY261]MCF0072234.1 hypothetical protein [Dyadobacter sp. CY261]